MGAAAACKLNVLLGRNGYGKSHLLRAVAAILQKNDEKVAEFFKGAAESGALAMSLLKNEEEYEILYKGKLFEKSVGKVLSWRFRILASLTNRQIPWVR